jgi:ribonuclease E
MPADTAQPLPVASDVPEGAAPASRDGQERRGRGRDRYNRDRRERGPRESVDAESVNGAPDGEAIERAPTLQPEPEAGIGAFAEAPPRLPSAPQPIEVATRAAPAPVSRSLPKVQPFELPLADLAQIAEGSGLQWINSDAERVAQVRAAIEAEPKPVHVPRERAPAPVFDDGPLVLVETRRDLSSLTLPFEAQSNPSAGRAPAGRSAE